MTKRQLPNHIPGTARKWRLRKRQEWRAVQEALHAYMMGCVYTPEYRKFDSLREKAKEIEQSLRGDWRIP